MITEEQRVYIFNTLEKMKKSLENRGLNVYAIALKGSQNYNLHDENSDIDANAVLIPSLSDLRSKQSHKYTFPEGEVTYHHIYDFAAIVSKGNPQWVECCQTEFVIGDLSLFKNIDINPRALGGMAREKVVAFSKRYPSRVEYIDKFGYDPKQLHHIVRLADLIESGKNVMSYHGDSRSYMMDIKRGRYPSNLAQAEDLRDKSMARINNYIEKHNKLYVQPIIDYNTIDKIVMKGMIEYFGYSL